MKLSFALIVMICLLPIISADLFPTDITTISIGSNEEIFGVNIQLPPEIFNSSAATSNSTEFWLTTIGVLDNVDAVQHNNVGGTLTISETYLRSFGDGEWLQLDGGNSPSADINWGGFNIDNINNATITDRLFLGNEGHWIKLGADGFDGLSTEAFSLQHLEEREAGTITFILSFNKTNSDIDGISIMAQAGLNNSGGYLGNSWMIAPNNLTNNLTDLSNCFFVINATGNTPRISCDTSDTGADLFVQDDIQSGGTMFADGGIRAETLVDFIMNGEDVNIQNGSLHIFTPVTFEQGVIEGNEVTTFIEDFTGGLGSFINLQSDLGNWFPTSNILCDDGDCANSVGISGVGNIIMEANISTVNINSTSLNFIYSLVNIIGANDFEVTVNNNVGSGEVSIFTDSTTNVVLSSQSIALPASMSDQPEVSIRFNCDVTNANRQCFVDTIRVNGTAIETTLTNVSGFDSVIKFGDGVLAADGFPERGIIYNASSDTIIIRGNATFENIIEQDLNITNSITLNSSTIFDWADIVNTPLFPSFILANGSTLLTGLWNYGSFGINGSGDFSTSGNIKLLSVTNKFIIGITEDFSIFSDNSDMIIQSENMIPSDELHFKFFEKYTFDAIAQSVNFVATINMLSPKYFITASVDHEIFDSSDDLVIKNLNMDKDIIFSINNAQGQFDFMTIDSSGTSLIINTNGQTYSPQTGVIKVEGEMDVGTQSSAMFFKPTITGGQLYAGIISQPALDVEIIQIFGFATESDRLMNNYAGFQSKMNSFAETSSNTIHIGFENLGDVNSGGGTAVTKTMIGARLEGGWNINSGTSTYTQIGLKLEKWNQEVINGGTPTFAKSHAIESDGGHWVMLHDGSDGHLQFGATPTDLEIYSDGTNGVITTNANLDITSVLVELNSAPLQTTGDILANEFNIIATIDHEIFDSSDDLVIKNLNVDKDIIFSFNDGGTQTNFIKLASSAGSLKIDPNGHEYSGTGIIDIQGDMSALTGSATLFRPTITDGGLYIALFSKPTITSTITNEVDHFRALGVEPGGGTHIQTGYNFIPPSFDRSNGVSTFLGFMYSASSGGVVTIATSDKTQYGALLKGGFLAITSGNPLLTQYGIKLEQWNIESDFGSGTPIFNSWAIHSNEGNWFMEDGDFLLNDSTSKIIWNSRSSVHDDGVNLIINTTRNGTASTSTSNLAYFTGNVSATGFITRTSAFDKSRGSALDLIKDADELKPNGEINHSAFASYTLFTVKDYSRPEIVIVKKSITMDIETYNTIKDNIQININILSQNKENITFEYDVEETYYPHTKLEEGVDLGGEVDVLRQATYELREEIKLMKVSLCRLGEIVWC